MEGCFLIFWPPPAFFLLFNHIFPKSKFFNFVSWKLKRKRFITRFSLIHNQYEESIILLMLIYYMYEESIILLMLISNQYEESGSEGWSREEKELEMFSRDSRQIILRDGEELIAFSHFRQDDKPNNRGRRNKEDYRT